MKIIIILFCVLIGFYFFNKICLWAENRGFLYYRHKKSEKSAVGAAMLELQGFLNPSAKYTIEMQQNRVKHKKREEDVPGDLKDPDMRVSCRKN